MMEPSLIQRERALLHHLLRLAADRARAETDVETTYQQRTEALAAKLEADRQRIRAELETDTAETNAMHQETRRVKSLRFEAKFGQTQKEYADIKKRLNVEFEHDRRALEKKTKEAAWSVTTVCEANRTEIEERHQNVVRTTDAGIQRVAAVQTAAIQVMEAARQDTAYEKKIVFLKPEHDQPLEQLEERLEDVEERLQQLQQCTTFKLFRGRRLIWLFLVVWVLGTGAAAGIGFLTQNKDWPTYLAAGAGGVALVEAGVWFGLRLRARALSRRLYQPLRLALDETAAWCKSCRDDSDEKTPRDLAKNKDIEAEELRRVQDKFARKWDDMQRRYQEQVDDAEEKYVPLLAQMKETFDKDIKQLDREHAGHMAELRQRSESETSRVQQEYRDNTSANEQRHNAEWEVLRKQWRDGLARHQAEVAALHAEASRLFPTWEQAEAEGWAPPTAVPEGMLFGETAIGLEQIPEGKPTDSRLPTLADFSLPALLPFPIGGSMLVQASDAGRAQAVQLLQAVMLHWLTALPPGKVRFTILDPVGLGENFASFMHLADHDELLVTHRIWTEPQQIEQRLIDLTEHMENVIQKYLRNQFSSLEEYNAQAGEIAEPYRVLVVANFPTNFTESTARRLLSIAASGATSGVYTLVSLDKKMSLPQDFQLKDLERLSLNLQWKEGRFAWKDSDFGKYPLRVDAPPPADVCTRIMNRVGAAAKAAGRVEVPFEYIAPAEGQWWTSDSRAGIRVALGRAGATKLQLMQLGHGTSQHVLIAGKTGSGKSTLLHALITNLALHYSPDEVEFYLIDFKKGVEFKTYAAHELPHARVVAIESEREFGLSVLQRLDQELKQRGERFRAAGVQDLNAYRNANGQERTPRILLIVDEFQEFFTEDDKIAQDVSLLLDRLVRQGRAFGIHVLLGSQTLGGAYSLARSTLGQMAVRIALQCSEADANLILSEENTAARLLTRPGEAIYNDANGLKEGNNFFQVVWLPDERKDSYLNRVQDLARARHLPPRSQIIFEGNAPADLRKNHLLQQLFQEAGEARPARKAFHAWLGEAMAIKDPTAAVFRPQSGSNVLIIGQQDEAALGILSAALIGLAAQTVPLAPWGRGAGVWGESVEMLPPQPQPLSPEERGETTAVGPRFYLLDGTPVDHPDYGYLARLAGVLPDAVKAGGFRELPGLIAEVAAEVERRQLEADTENAPWFLMIHGIQRLRDLRKQEEDFGFSREDKAVSPAQQFSSIVREGPAVGVYTLVWCDSLNNANRAFDRQGLREFEMKILFQMSVNDSSVLIDTPAASKLGMHHALYYTEERGQPEKFRPYGLPSDEWLESVKQALSSGSPG